MKYDNNIFGLSAYACENSLTTEHTNKEIIEIQKRLLKIFFKRFRRELKNEAFQSDILKIKIKSEFYQEPEEGYNLITRLIEENSFDYFASQYCIYLGNMQNVCDEHQSAYYEIVWDCRTYYEQINAEKIEFKSLFGDNIDGNSVEVLEKFKELPEHYQKQIIGTFKSEVTKRRKDNLHKLAIDTCKSKGHSFNDWEKVEYSSYERNPYLGSKDYIVPKEWENIIVNNVKWNRVCSRCGLLESMVDEPKELIAARTEQDKKEEILKLEKRLSELKSTKGKGL